MDLLATPGIEPALVLALAVLVDRFVGEFPAALHPVVWMGKVVGCAARLAPAAGVVLPFLAGLAIALAVPLLFAGFASLALGAVRELPLLYLPLAVWLTKSSFAVRELGRAADRVRGRLAAGSLDEARGALSSLCSRDASDLTGEEVAGAAIESVAENASDSVVAPLLFWAFLGVPGALLYRAVNTTDAMIGYRGRYEYLGKAGARLDDLANLIPARITAILLLVAGFLNGHDARRGFAVWRRDRANTASPNAGHPMSVMAGLLGHSLTKRGAYRLGDPVDRAAPESIAASWRIARLASFLGLAIAAAIRFCLDRAGVLVGS